jgi:hypothetical protein
MSLPSWTFVSFVVNALSRPIENLEFHPLQDRT